MTNLLVLAVVVLGIAAAVLHLCKQRRLACWVLFISPAFLCGALLLDLSRGVAVLGAGAFDSDKRQLPYAVAFLALGLLAAFRTQWPWVFWIVWLINAAACAILVYLAFFWKVFS